MARCGNHGQIIPRDGRLLARLYWIEGKTLTDIGGIYGVTHRSVGHALTDCGIPIRAKAARRQSKCIECGEPVKTIKHAVHGYEYGVRCETHHKAYKTKLAREYVKRPDVQVRKKRFQQRSYYHGPLNPTGELQWISKSRALLRAAKRLLGGRANPAA